MTRRIQKLLAAASIVVAVTVGLPGTAHAAGESIGGCLEEKFEEFETETVALEESGLPEDELVAAQKELAEEYEGIFEGCVDAPNQLLPETNEIIWGGIGFLIVFLFISKFGFPAIKQGMNDRTERIRADLEEAESAKVDAQAVLADYKAQLADAKSESGRIIEEARQQADDVRRDQEAKLQTELGDMRAKASADIEASKAQVMGDLQSDVAALAIGAAEIVIEKNLDQATQVQLIENYINQVNQRS